MGLATTAGRVPPNPTWAPGCEDGEGPVQGAGCRGCDPPSPWVPGWVAPARPVMGTESRAERREGERRVFGRQVCCSAGPCLCLPG